MAIGWYIGLQFERATVGRSLRALPEIVAAAVAVIALCGAAAWILSRFEGYDAFTAFLATSPGGIDSIAIIALDGGADTAFVMALQTLRILLVILTGPPTPGSWPAPRFGRVPRAARRQAIRRTGSVGRRDCRGAT